MQVDNGEMPDDIRLFFRTNGPSEADVMAITEQVLCHYDQVLLAYLYGSFLRQDSCQDIDIALLCVRNDGALCPLQTTDADCRGD